MNDWAMCRKGNGVVVTHVPTGWTLFSDQWLFGRITPHRSQMIHKMKWNPRNEVDKWFKFPGWEDRWFE